MSVSLLDPLIGSSPRRGWEIEIIAGDVNRDGPGRLIAFPGNAGFLAEQGGGNR